MKAFLSLSLFFSTLFAQNIVDCRVVFDDILECNPYGKRLHYVKEIHYDRDSKKLIIDKNIPIIKEKNYVKIISVKEMMKKFNSINQSLRLKGSDSFEVTEKLSKPIIIKKVEKTKKTIPFLQKFYGNYMIVKGDSLYRMSDKFNVPVNTIAKMNGLTDKKPLRVGIIIKLPLAQYKIDSLATKYKKGKNKKLFARFDINTLGTHKLRVTATAYTSHPEQTDDTPFLAAWNNKLSPGMKIIAVSRDLLTRFGMYNGTKVRIGGLKGYYHVRDKMNKRYKKRIDIYMGLDLKKALKWGRRSIVIYWRDPI